MRCSHLDPEDTCSSSLLLPPLLSSARLPFSFVNKDVAKATCLCLLEEASHSAMVSEVDRVSCAQRNTVKSLASFLKVYVYMFYNYSGCECKFYSVPCVG